MIYLPKHFQLHELVPKDVYDNFDHNYLWTRFDVGLLKAIDMLREKFGKCVINNWFWGGEFEYSGYRPLEWYDKPTFSFHCLFRAFDLKFENASAEEVRAYIRENKKLFGKYISGVENGVSWVHIDTRNYNGINFFGEEIETGSNKDGGNQQ